MRAGRRLLARLDRAGWVTWERQSPGAEILTVTNAWPSAEQPMHGIFLARTVDALAAEGVPSDVLFVRGYRGAHVYLAAGVALAALAPPGPGSYRLVNSHGGETALAARCFWGGPVMASYWGSDILGPQAGGWRSRLKLLVQSRLLRAHSRLLTATTTKSEQMEGCLPAAVRARNRVIPDGVDRERFAPIDQASARAALGWPADGIEVISVGRPIALKRLDLAQEAVREAARTLPALRWRGVSDTDPADMPLVYNAADCLIHTSISEGSPNVVKEALACNLPVVATASGDIETLLAGVEPSAVCPPGAAAQALATALLECVAQGRRSNGRTRSAHLGAQEIARQTVARYRELAPDLAIAAPITRS